MPVLVTVLILGVIALGASAVALRPSPRVLQAEAIYAGMAAMLGLLVARPTWFAPHERYRAWGDGAFLLPWLMVLPL